MKLLPPPGPQRTRQFVLLTVLAGALAVFGWRYAPWRTAAAPAPSSNLADATQAAAKGSATQKPPATTAMPEPVKLDKLEPVPDEPGAGRNLFRFGQRPLPPAPKPVVTPPPVVQAPPPPQPVGPPPIELQFKGFLKRPDNLTYAILIDPKTGAVHNALEGQVLDGKYKVLKIGESSVIVAYVDGTGQRTLTQR
jgi:hypothetical protein